MGVAIDYEKELINLTKELPDNKLKELINYAQFLKEKEEKFTYTKVKDSAEYVREIRKREAKRIKTGRKFIEELIEWQKSNS
ncbi:MAG: hypothetical protein AB1606_04865 [Nitrospirota bacterium]